MSSTQEVRFHGEEINFGNLTGLIGTWQGANGFNMISVPDQQGGFQLLVEAYTEDLVIDAIPVTTPNRGLIVIENIPTLQYSTTIKELDNGAVGSIIHVEGGFWELLQFPVRNDGFDIFRVASVPHGNAVEAMGVSSVTQGRPVIPAALSGTPTGDVPDLNGYNDPFGFPLKFPNFIPASPNKTLEDYLDQQEAKGQVVVETVTLQVSTQNKGGIANISSIQRNATATEFDATFWIETVEDQATKQTFKQLQYSQRIMIEFPIKSDLSGQTICWPHINVNTLTLAQPVSGGMAAAVAPAAGG